MFSLQVCESRSDIFSKFTSGFEIFRLLHKQACIEEITG